MMYSWRFSQPLSTTVLPNATPAIGPLRPTLNEPRHTCEPPAVSPGATATPGISEDSTLTDWDTPLLSADCFCPCACPWPWCWPCDWPCPCVFAFVLTFVFVLCEVAEADAPEFEEALPPTPTPMPVPPAPPCPPWFVMWFVIVSPCELFAHAGMPAPITD